MERTNHFRTVTHYAQKAAKSAFQNSDSLFYDITRRCMSHIKLILFGVETWISTKMVLLHTRNPQQKYWLASLMLQIKAKCLESTVVSSVVLMCVCRKGKYKIFFIST